EGCAIVLNDGRLNEGSINSGAIDIGFQTDQQMIELLIEADLSSSKRSGWIGTQGLRLQDSEGRRIGKGNDGRIAVRAGAANVHAYVESIPQTGKARERRGC